MNRLQHTADRDSRKRIAENLHEGLFVEAGAGTGKTTEMVARIVHLIRRGSTTIDRLAAITFTETAAAELRDRVRRGLEEQSVSPAATEEEKRRCREAIVAMDGASIQTLHSFAASLLRERPLEAGLPPNFRIAEPIEADIRFEDKWQSWLHGDLLTGDTALELLRLIKLGLKTDHLRDATLALHSNYDRISRPFPAHPEPPRRAVARLVEAIPMMKNLYSLCLDKSDHLYQHMRGVLSLATALSAMQPSDDYALMALARGGRLKQIKGDKKKWAKLPSGENSCSELKALLSDIEEIRQSELEAVKQAGLAVLLEKLRLAVLAYADERRTAGVAEFHDLLVWARDTLRDNPAVRKHFQNKYNCILIDEFQDTDPIQAEIAFYLASGPTADGLDLDERDWQKLSALPGKLFVVGDPRQSIYRFRRADIATVDTVREMMSGCNAPLTHNFRSQRPVIDWVNHVFTRWMIKCQGVQPPYIKLEHAELPLHARLIGCVKYIGGYCENEQANRLRLREAQDVALLLQQIRMDAWQVRDADGSLRDAEFRDVCILLPSRTGLAALERRLSEAMVPYRIESESFILGTQDVKELLNCLRAIDSPADQVALVGALRSSAFACSDEDLLLWIEGGGRLDYTDPGTGDGIVKEALATLQAFHTRRRWLQADRLIEVFIADRRMPQSAYGRSRPREKLRRLQAVIDLARAYARVEGSSLRGFLDWMDRRAEEGSRMVETPVPDADEDAVRIMTVHAAKGLEFPIVIMLGLGDRSAMRLSSVIFDKSGNCEVRIGSSTGEFKTAGYDGLKEIEKEAEEAERVRLKYVAATRARDHLVLSLYHSSEKTDAAAILGFCEDAPGIWEEIDLSAVSPYRPGVAAVGERNDSAADLERWKEKRALVLAQSSRPAAVAVTDLVKMAKQEAEGGEVYYRAGRGSSSLGRAVHSVLQSIDLATGAGLEDISRAQAAAEGIAGQWQEVAGLAGNGLQSDVVRRAVESGSYRREVFISVPVEGKLLEGIMDIVFEEDGGLVIADYKTDAIDSENELLRKKELYELQAGLYALMAQEATGRPVRQVVLVFLRSKIEVAPLDMQRLIAEARSSVAGGT